MADARSPVLEPGADLKHLESMLDDKNQKKRNKSKKFDEPYEGKLEGWSPVDEPMEKLTLNPVEDKKKNLSKAERKKLAAEAFAKAGGVPKREKLSKAERRAQQEASRQKKEATNLPNKPKKTETAAPTPRTSGCNTMTPREWLVAPKPQSWCVLRPRNRWKCSPICRNTSARARYRSMWVSPIRRRFIRLSSRWVSSGNARCIAMITAFQQVIDDYVTPQDKQLRRDLDKRLRPLIQYLIDCRPHGIGMGNAIRRLRRVIGSTPPELSEEEAKRRIREEMDDYVQSRILLASRAVVKNAQSKISEGDVILTYARANVVEELLLETAKTSPEIAASLRIIVVDSRPHYEGRKLVSALASAGLQCSYLQINALSYIMREVTKVFLGAAAFMSNGVAVARVGTALVAMTAHEANVPVLFCSETYKFSDRVQLDAITHNELGDPDELVSSYCIDKRRRTGGSAASGHILSDWRDLADLKLLNLVYDVTPIDYVSMVVTELGMIPPTSIPAVLREYSRDGVVDGAL
ncbi:Initiation factor 2B-related [Phytophthora cactorum]|nr:Initiation factor 2B-related [Phytophthora cactorum]